MKNQFDNPKQFLDPELEAMLNLLRQTPARDPRAFARGRARFLTEAREMLGLKTARAQIVQGLFLNTIKEKLTMTALKHRFAYTVLLVILVLTFTIFGGIGATAYAAQSALPGDALYPIKTSLEQTRVALARDAALQVQLHLRYAERRLDEIAALIAEGRYTAIDTATQEFNIHAQQAIMALQTVANGEPQRAAELSTQISAALSRYAQTLSGLLVSVPPSIKPDVERAIMVSNQASQGEIEYLGWVKSISPEAWVVDSWTFQIAPETEIEGVINVGDLVEVHAIMAEDGWLIAREIEPEEVDDENVNQNENENHQDDEMEIYGVVEAISDTSWTISGRLLQVTPQTEIRGAIQIGNMVEVHAVQTQDGSLIALSIELTDQDTNTNEDDNFNTNQNANSNENNNINANQNGNTNTNENDNANYNENQNSNENDNSNENGNVNP